MLKLHLGCQYYHKAKLDYRYSLEYVPGWKTVDIENADYITDLSSNFEEWEEVTSLYGQVDDVLASNILQTFSPTRGVHFLSNCYQLLTMLGLCPSLARVQQIWTIVKPGGTLHMVVPNINTLLDCRQITLTDRLNMLGYSSIRTTDSYVNEVSLLYITAKKPN